MVDEVELPLVGPVQILEDHDERVLDGHPLEEGAPRGEEIVAAAGLAVGHAEELLEARCHPAPLGLVGHVGLQRLCQLGSGGGRVIKLQQPDPAANHLGQRPEADPLAVGRRPPLVPQDPHLDAVDVLEELPGQPALADPCLPDDRDEAWPPLARRGVEEVLDEAQLRIAAHEWGLQLLATADAAALGDDPYRAVGGHRADLPLQLLLAERFEDDRALGAMAGRLADDHDPRRRHRLESGRGVDQVAGDHPLVRGPQCHGCLAGEHPGPCLEHLAVVSQVADSIDKFEGGPHRSLGIVLVRDGRAPDGHHRVADELLYRPAVAVDDLLGDRKVLGQLLADRLGITGLGEGSEANQVGEEHGHQLPFGHRAGCDDLWWQGCWPL